MQVSKIHDSVWHYAMVRSNLDVASGCDTVIHVQNIRMLFVKPKLAATAASVENKFHATSAMDISWASLRRRRNRWYWPLVRQVFQICPISSRRDITASVQFLAAAANCR